MDFSATLIKWYRHNHRKLPWRETKDPYLIWLSEVILQQTRVGQGLDYYYKFSTEFPTITSLATAEEARVLKLWQGLGYYSRARNLLKTAREVVDKHQATFPASHTELLKLKGIGPYTAAAIASFAFGLPYPVVDGNVFRVLARLFGIVSPVPGSSKLFTEVAGELMDKKRPALFNQAIMEFGATLCKPQKPDCEICPFSMECFALKNKKVDALPIRKPKAQKKDRFISFYHLAIGGNTFLRKRTEKDIWQNLYEFPSIEFPKQPTPQESLKAFSEMHQLRNIKLLNGPVKLKHVLTHQNIHANIFHLDAWPSPSLENCYTLVPLGELKDYAIPGLMAKYLSGL